jgi:pyruvate kinase
VGNGLVGPRIAATVGQATCTEHALLQLAEAGACMFRYNLAARLGLDMHRQRMATFRRARGKASQEMLLMLDLPLPGAKYRVGMLPNPSHLISAGTVLKFRTGTETRDISDHVPVHATRLGTRVVPNQHVTVGDGDLALRVLEIHDDDSFSALALTTAYLPCQKSLNFGQIELADLADHGDLLDFVAETRPDYIALSFVETLEAAALVVDELDRRGLQRSSYRAIAKIETETGVANARTVATAFDMLMVARGDLALNINFSYLGEIQEYLIKQAGAAGRQCMVATDVCESVATTGVPNRAELVGMYALAKQKVDYILLAKETSSLPNPIDSVKVLRDVIVAATRPMFP